MHVFAQGASGKVSFENVDGEDQVQTQLSQLVRLQDIDLQLLQYQQEQDAIPQKLKEIEERMAEARHHLEEAQTTLDRINKEKKSKELDLKDAEEKVRKIKDHLTNLKTNKEYQAYMTEVDTAKIAIHQIEDQLLQLMEQSELLQESVATSTKALGAEEVQCRIAQEQLQTEIDNMHKVMSHLQQHWTEQATGISEEILEDYRKIRTGRKGISVVPLEGLTCGGCHFNLPPQVVAEVKVSDKILRCSYCGRFLYTKD